MRRHPRAIAIARRDHAPGRVWVLLLLSLAFACAAIGAAAAQTTTPAPLPPKTPQSGPTLPPAAQSGESRGVIRPPATVDPGMTRATPNTGTMPVIPPPGTPGGNSRVEPK